MIINALKKAFAPEFLNRIDDVIIFNNLQLNHINKIIDIELEKLFLRTNELGYEIKLSKKAKDFIAEKGFDKQYGARPLKRAIQKYLEDELAEEIMKSKVQTGDTVKVDLNKEKSKLVLKTLTQKKTTK